MGNDTIWVYLGTYTRGSDSEGIYRCALDLEKGEPELVSVPRMEEDLLGALGGEVAAMRGLAIALKLNEPKHNGQRTEQAAANDTKQMQHVAKQTQHCTWLQCTWSR